MKKIAVVPIDNRPICYTLIEQICAVDKDIQLFLPKRELLGGLVEPSDIERILDWLDELPQIDYLILSLDTIAYGGLTNSRRCPEGYDEILMRIKRLEKIVALFKKTGTKVYAFSSIMRISNNNINEEEKEYWDKFGKRIFEYSYHAHKSRRLKTANCVINTIPNEILEDYLNTRKRNFEINEYCLKLGAHGLFDTLIFSKDDTGEFGLNVEEAEILADMIKTAGHISIKTGADEIPLTLLARAIADGHKINVKPVFLHPKDVGKISKYEDITIENCVKSQLNLAGLEVTNEGEDLNFIINNFENTQGDLVLGETNASNAGINFDTARPYFIADVNNANGADFGFVEQILSGPFDKNFYGYSGYNTSANTIGCAICIAVVKFLAKNYCNYNDSAFKKLMFVRFLDDWSYQAQIRKKVREIGQKQGRFDISPYKNDFKPYEDKICKFLNLNCDKIDIEYTLPWQRSFEIEIGIQEC